MEPIHITHGGVPGKPVDRSRRAAAADALAAFLRGAEGEAALRERLRAIGGGLRDEATDEYLSYLCFSLAGDTHLRRPLGGLSERAWRHLVRDLAFLKSDLQMRASVWRPSRLPDEGTQARVARWHVLVLATGAALVPLVGWWALAVCWVGSCLTFMGWMWRYEWVHGKDDRRRLAEQVAAEPFATEADWLAHRHLLDGYRLPEYDPAVHRPRWQRFFNGAVLALCLAILIPMVAYLYFCSVALWPIWVVLVAIQRPDREADGGEADEGHSPTTTAPR